MNCKDQNVSTLELLTKMLRVAKPLVGLPIVFVTGHTENAIQCNDGKNLSVDDLFRASIGVDNCGKPALRVKVINTCDVKANCAVPTGFDPMRDMFAYDSTTKTIALVLNISS